MANMVEDIWNDLNMLKAMWMLRVLVRMRTK